MMLAAGDGHRTLLLVEDDDDVRDAMAGSLRDEGYIVAEAGNGRLALDVGCETNWTTSVAVFRLSVVTKELTKPSAVSPNEEAP